MQYYTNSSDNIWVSDGCLHLRVLKQNKNGYEYTSGRVKTMGKKEFTFGKMEARIRMDNGKGLCPAFWMLSHNASWPNGGEFDIMEHINSENIVYGTIHDWNNGNLISDHGTKYNIDVTQWHTYGMIWTETQISFYVDNQVYWSKSVADGSYFPNYLQYHEPYYFLLNVAIGGTWPGAPDEHTCPAQMDIDYVRVYQETDNSGNNGGDSGCNIINNLTLNDIYYTNSSWQEYNNGSASANGKDLYIELPEASGTQWQAQTKWNISPSYTLLQGIDYTLEFDITSNTALPKVSAKAYTFGIDNVSAAYGEFALAAGERRHISLSGTASSDCPNAGLLFDFGGNPAGTVIQISNILLKESQCRPSIINNPPAKQTFISPNPCHTQITLVNEAPNACVRIYDTSSRLVGIGLASYTDTSRLPRGIYMAVCNKKTYKFMVE